MAEIYKSASSVWIWLGEDSDGVGDAFQLIRSTRGPLYGRLGSDRVAHAPDSAIFDFRRRTYFTRTWIIQEVLLARDLTVYCGEHSVAWDALTEWALRMPLRRTLRHAPLTLLAQARSRRQEYEGTDGYASLMSDFCPSQCADVRDKVYGLLGLLPEHRDSLRIDYAISIPVLFFRTLSLFEEARKVRSAEHLRKSLGMVWPQLYSVPQDAGQMPTSSISITPISDKQDSIGVILVLAGPV